MKTVNGLIFGAFALIALGLLYSPGFAPRTVGHVAALLLIAFFGYECASTVVRRSRVPGILAFVVGWFWLPIVPLVPLWAWWWIMRPPKRQLPEPGEKADDAVSGIKKEDATAEEPSTTPLTALTLEQRSFLQTSLILKVAATELAGKVKRLHAPFSSVYGDGVIPILLDADGEERGVYVDVGPWDQPTKERCFRWLGLLRTSDREDLEVEIRSNVDVPEGVSHYARRSPTALFELVGLLHFKWGSVEAPKANASNLKRLASEYLELDLPNEVAGLEALDKLVVDLLRPSGHILGSTPILLGCFFGEVLIERHGGRWLTQGDDPEQAVVELMSPAGVLEADVIGKVKKLYRNGLEDSTAWMARSIAERLS